MYGQVCHKEAGSDKAPRASLNISAFTAIINYRGLNVHAYCLPSNTNSVLRTLLLGAFEKRKHLSAVCPSVRIKLLDSHWIDFHGRLYSRSSLESVGVIQFWLKKNTDTLREDFLNAFSKNMKITYQLRDVRLSVTPHTLLP
jgi:hypothetical protein